MEFLKEVLHGCGESIVMKMVWLEKITKASGTEEEQYQLLISSNDDLSQNDCLNRIAEKFGLKVKRQADLWDLSVNN